MQTLRVVLASVGICSSAAPTISTAAHMVELIPTVLRYEFMDSLLGLKTGLAQLINIY